MRLVVAYGMGTNSVALLVGMQERGIIPDAILSSDTKGERPETYAHLEYMRHWCLSMGFPPITIVGVHQPSKHGSLERFCLINKSLPSIAFGYKRCSIQFKVEPQNKWVKDNYKDEEVIRAIGFDAGEAHRAKDYEGEIYPLIEWGWDRDDCIAAIDRAGIPQPGKSSCFFCPNSKPSEIRRLAARHPDLYARAIAMEDNAKENLISVKGLGRTYSWRDVIATSEMFPDSYNEMPCGCYDG